MKKIALILSGCGVFDGSEIHETVITMLALAKHGVSYQCFAPNIEQLHVVNHLTGEVVDNETRNVLVESARIARGDISDIRQLDVNEFDALILPGGFGAAKNLCDFALQGANATVNEDVLATCQAFAKAHKPAGYICISPAMIPLVYGHGAQLTIGTDQATAEHIKALGGQHIECAVGDIVVDEANKLVSTPAYMLAESIEQAAQGIEKLVAKVVAMS